MMFTPPALVKPELEKTSAEPFSSALRRPMLSLPQISGQRLISSNPHSSSTGKNSNKWRRRNPEDQEKVVKEEEAAEAEVMAEEEAEVATEVAKAEEEEVAIEEDPEAEAKAEEDPEVAQEVAPSELLPCQKTFRQVFKF
jgi:hypothetical protein